MKLNLGCGRNIKIGFINIDSYERGNKLDVVCDLTKRFPFDDESCEYIYSEHLIEHFTWLDGIHFIRECYRCLKPKGILRLVLPHYKKIFEKYINGDQEFFKVFFDELNNLDYPYYYNVYENPEKVKKERVSNPPPKWHISNKLEDRKRLALRVRKYIYSIEIVDWFCHQYHEHLSLWDYQSLRGHLLEIGFSNVRSTDIKDIDSHQPTRITSSLYIEGVK